MCKNYVIFKYFTKADRTANKNLLLGARLKLNSLSITKMINHITFNCPKEFKLLLC